MKIFGIQITVNELISLLSLIIALVALISNIVIAYFNKKYQYKEAVFKTLFECAYKEYEHRTNILMEMSRNGKSVTLVGFEGYIFSYHKLYKLVSSGKEITEDDVRKYISYSHNLSETALKERLKNK